MECKNCGSTVQDKYCPHCGQKISVSRITLASLVRDLPHAVFHVDKGFLYNFTKLFRQPGRMINEYLAGRRRPFYHPASYLVVALVLNYLVVKIIDLHFYDEHELVSMQPLEAKAITDYDAMQWWFLEHTYIYILIAIPVSTFFLWMMLRWLKKNYNLAETAAIILFTIAQGVLIQTLIYLLFGWVKSGPFIRTVETINVVILISYAAMVMYQLPSGPISKGTRLLLSAAAGFGLAVLWVASGYLLYMVMK